MPKPIDRNTVLIGDAKECLKRLPDESVHCVVTSPPYWGLRAYHTNPVVWGGESGCRHKWVEQVRVRKGSTNGRSDLGSSLASGESSKTIGPGEGNEIGETKQYRIVSSGVCSVCGAWRGDLGAELTPEMYVQHLVEVFREVRRVLRADGSLWLNLGDSYSGSGGAGGDYNKGGTREGQPRYNGRRGGGLKSKDLAGIPHRVAFALRDDGWYLRQDIVWAKAVSGQKEWLKEVRQAAIDTGIHEEQVEALVARLNPFVGSCMPEGPTDRCVRSHEYVFLLTKSMHYYFDWMAIEEQSSTKPHAPGNAHGDSHMAPNQRVEGGHAGHVLNPKRTWATSGTRRRRSVWITPTKGYEGEHYAAFPPGLIEPMILAGTSAQGCCSECGTFWRRRIERKGKSVYQRIREDTGWSSTDMREVSGELGLANRAAGAATGGRTMLPNGKRASFHGRPAIEQVGWEPGCTHGLSTEPCVVLDPFLGSGTTAMVASKLGRRYVGVELKEDYVKLTWEREGVGRTFKIVVPGEDEVAKSCPKCGSSGSVGELFGWRMMKAGANGTAKRVRRAQSYCKACRFLPSRVTVPTLHFP